MKEILFDWIIPKSLRNSDPKKSKNRNKYGRVEGWVSIVSNFLLFVFKLIIGLLINSIALIADSIHSLSDVSTSIVVIIGYKISDKPADRHHPFGHQRAEYITSLVIAIILGIAGFEFITSSVDRITNPEVQKVTIGVILFVILTILMKTWLGAFANYLGKKINSSALRAEALHHYTDTISSILVLAAIIGSGLGYPFLDGVGGIGVGVLLIWAGFSIARESADSLIGTSPSPKFVKKIQDISMNVDKVLNTHEIVVHSYGDKHFISLHVEVNQNLGIMKIHDVGDKVKAVLREKLDAYATVHVDPIDIDSQEVKQANAIVDEVLSGSSDIKNFHDLRMTNQEGHSLIIFDIVPQNPRIKTCEDIDRCSQLRKKLHKAFPDHELRIEIDPVYSFIK